MAEEDLIKIVMDVLGTEKVEQAKKVIEDEQAAIRKLGADLKATSITQEQFGAASLASAARIKQATADIAAGSKAGFNPQSLLEFSRAAEDAQYGIAGVVNNIPGLVASLGGGAGVVGAASLAAIGIAQLVKHWDEFSGLIGYGGTFKPPIEGLEKMQGELKKAQEEVEKLGQKTNLTWIELGKFKDAQFKVKILTEFVKDQQAVDASLKVRTEDDQKRGDAFGKAIAAGGDGSIAHGDYRDALAGQKDAKGQVYNFKRETATGFDDALRENWAAALEGNRRAIDSIAGALPEGNLFRENIGKLSPEQAERDKAGKEADKEHAQLMQERIREAERHVDDVSRDYQRRAGELAKPLQDRYTTSSASGTVVTEGQVRSKLIEGGVGEAEAKKMAGAVLDVLDRGFRETLRERAGKLGTDTEGAKGSILSDAAAGAERDRDAAKRALGLDRKAEAPQVFNGASALRDAIQTSELRDKGIDRSIVVQEAMRDKLGQAIDVLNRIASTREVARWQVARCG